MTKNAYCVDCYVEYKAETVVRIRETRERDLEATRTAERERYYANHERNKATQRAYAARRRAEDPEAVRNRERAWRKRNVKRTNAYSALQRAAKLDASPSWLTKEQRQEMVEFYLKCPRGWHVDHILPLDGAEVCGLHVPWNLQYLPAQANRLKRGRFNPKLWPEQLELGYPKKLSGAMIATLNRRYQVHNHS